MTLLFHILLILTTTTGINSKTFYKIFSSASEIELNQNIALLEKAEMSAINKVYLGALLTKRAEGLKDVKQKIATFKSGVEMIENVIAENPKNIEFRFIRYIIQENAPKILKYNTNMLEDEKFIKQNFKNASQVLQDEIKKYATISSSLKI